MTFNLAFFTSGAAFFSAFIFSCLKKIKSVNLLKITTLFAPILLDVAPAACKAATVMFLVRSHPPAFLKRAKRSDQMKSESRIIEAFGDVQNLI